MIYSLSPDTEYRTRPNKGNSPEYPLVLWRISGHRTFVKNDDGDSRFLLLCSLGASDADNSLLAQTK